MKRHHSLRLFALSAVAALTLAAGCNNENPEPPEPPEPPAKKVASVAVSPQTLTLKPGETQLFEAAVSPSDADNKAVTWSSTPAGWVDASGRLTVPADATPGSSATVTATAADGGEAKGTATVTVAAPEPAFIPVTQITIPTLEVVAGEAVTLTATVVPEDATRRAIVWSIVDGGGTGASISSDGILTATGAGTVTLLATIAGGADDKTDFTREFEIEVSPEPEYTISVSPSSLDFGSLTEGYTSPPAAKTVTVTNTGTETVTLASPSTTNYTTGVLSAATLAAGGTATFTVRPKSGLAQGNHNETITVNGTGGTSATIAARFTVSPSGTVEPPPPTATLTIGAQEDAMTEGGGDPVATYFGTSTGVPRGEYALPNATLQNAPQGVDVHGVAVEADGKVTLFLRSDGTQRAGTYPNLKVKITTAGADVISNSFTLTIGQAVSTAILSITNRQGDDMLAGSEGDMTDYGGTSVDVPRDRHYTSPDVVLVGNVPGVSVDNLEVYMDGSISLNLIGDGTQRAGTYTNLRVRLTTGDIDVTSNTFSLTISPAAKSLAIGTQQGVIIAGFGEEQEVSFSLAATGITPEKNRHERGGWSVSGLPLGMELSQLDISNGAGGRVMLYAREDATLIPNTYNIKLTVDGCESNTFQLVIIAGRTIDALTKMGDLPTEETVGDVAYIVSTTGFSSGMHPLSITGLPQGVVVHASTITLNASGQGGVILHFDGSQSQGTYNNPRITIDGITGSFKLIINAIPRRIVSVALTGSTSVKENRNAAYAFLVKTMGISPGKKSVSISSQHPGISIHGGVTTWDILAANHPEYDGQTMLNLYFDDTVSVGTYPVTLTIDGASITFNVTVVNHRITSMILTSPDNNLRLDGSSITYTVNTIGIPAGQYTPTFVGLPYELRGEFTTLLDTSGDTGQITLRMYNPPGGAAMLPGRTITVTISIDGCNPYSFQVTT